MARQRKQDRVAALAKKTLRVIKKHEQAEARIKRVENQAVEAMAAQTDVSHQKVLLRDLRRKRRGPARQMRSMVARLESMGGGHLLEQPAPKR